MSKYLPEFLDPLFSILDDSRKTDIFYIKSGRARGILKLWKKIWKTNFEKKIEFWEEKKLNWRKKII